MLTVEEALALVMAEARPLPPRPSPLIEARNRRLAEDITADGDQPPFDKALVDGYAIRSDDLSRAERLRVGETIVAGQVPTRALSAGEAAVIMTGAPLPPGADSVVMHEQTESLDGEVRFVRASEVRTGQNVLSRGRVHRAGDAILGAGMLLNAPALGLLASVGRTQVSIVPRPRVAILPTGDELVEPDRVPGPGQIRNSNAVMLEALVTDHGAIPRAMGIAPDEPGPLRGLIQDGLRDDVLIVTGGVSAGQRDLVPPALEEVGVRRVFHKIRLKPGKPLWFGVGPARHGRPGTLVFGLPGNPVSGLVGFLLLIRPALHLLEAGVGPLPAPPRVRLAAPYTHRGDRPTYHPARWVERTSRHEGVAGVVETLSWAGSADLLGVTQADGFAAFPAGDRVFAAGEIVPFLPLR
jgi:molybdopterin molybdotransferase